MTNTYTTTQGDAWDGIAYKLWGEERTARRTSVHVSINGHDATGYVAPSLLDFTYTDNISGKANEVQLSLQDRETRWNGPWKPQKGMEVVASLTVNSGLPAVWMS